MSERNLRIAIGALSLAGVAIAGYLTYARYADVSILCATGGGCETVQRSEYSVLAGIPVAVIGLVGYIVLLATAVLSPAWAAAAGAAAALSGLLFGVYLFVVQVAVIDAVCSWCVTSDVVLVAITILALLRLRGASFEPRAAT